MALEGGEAEQEELGVTKARWLAEKTARKAEEVAEDPGAAAPAEATACWPAADRTAGIGLQGLFLHRRRTFREEI